MKVATVVVVDVVVVVVVVRTRARQRRKHFLVAGADTVDGTWIGVGDK